MNLIEFAKGKNKLIIAEGGSGKTYMLMEMYKTILSSNESMLIPIYVPINQYGITAEDKYIRRYMIENYLEEVEDVNDNSALLRLKKLVNESQYTYVIMVDGINETSSSPSAIYSELNELGSWGNVQLLVTSRHDIKALYRFERIKLGQIDKEYLQETLTCYKDLSVTLQNLLRIPFYYRIFKSVSTGKISGITNPSELLEIYFKWLINRSEQTLMNDEYREFCELLINDFLPELAFSQINKVNYLIIEEHDINQKWNLFKNTNNIILNKNVIRAIEDFGIIKRLQGECYAFEHEICFDYFIELYFQKLLKELRSNPDCFNKCQNIIDVTFHYDTLKSPKAYNYGMNAIESIKHINTEDTNRKLDFIHVKISCAYAILHCLKKRDEINAIPLCILLSARKELKNIHVDKHSDSGQTLYKLFKNITLVQGNIGACYYQKSEYKQALKYHRKSMIYRKRMLRERKFKTESIQQNIKQQVADAYKNVASDYYNIACNFYGEKIRVKRLLLMKAIKNHYIAYNYLKATGDIAVYLNRLDGSVLELLKTGECKGKIIRCVFNGQKIGDVLYGVLKHAREIFESNKTKSWYEKNTTKSLVREIFQQAVNDKLVSEEFSHRINIIFNQENDFKNLIDELIEEERLWQ